jgi:hypothetical protein
VQDLLSRGKRDAGGRRDQLLHHALNQLSLDSHHAKINEYPCWKIISVNLDSHNTKIKSIPVLW